MILRWVLVGVLEAARGFRRLKGHKDMKTFVARLEQHGEATVVQPLAVDAKSAAAQPSSRRRSRIPARVGTPPRSAMSERADIDRSVTISVDDVWGYRGLVRVGWCRDGRALPRGRVLTNDLGRRASQRDRGGDRGRELPSRGAEICMV